MSRVIYSKPVYQVLSPAPGRAHHFLITDREGVERARAMRAAICGDSDCVVVCEPQTAPLVADAKRVAAEALGDYLAARLPELPAGTQLYLFGRERFIWPTQFLLQQLHVPRARCAVERCGPARRDVICIHCKQVLDAVAQSPVSCTGCGRLLHVYDHFSRRLGCYMGFQVNAECASEVPASEVLRP